MANETKTATIFKVKRLVDEVQLKKDLNFSNLELSNAMVEQASLFAHYGILAARASRQVDDTKLLLENTEAKVYRLIRDKMAEDGIKITEVQLEKQVSIHSQVMQFKRALNEAKQIEAIAKIATESFRQRKDMLIQEGAQGRAEMSGEVFTSRRNAVEEVNEASRAAILEKMKTFRKKETKETTE